MINHPSRYEHINIIHQIIRNLYHQKSCHRQLKFVKIWTIFHRLTNLFFRVGPIFEKMEVIGKDGSEKDMKESRKIVPHITYKPSYLYASKEKLKVAAVTPSPKHNNLRKRISWTNMDEHISNRSEEDSEKRPAKKASYQIGNTITMMYRTAVITE